MWSLETILASVATCVFTIGISWILYPAWAVRIADRLEWTVDELSGNESSNKSDGDDDAPRSFVLSLVIPAYNEQDRIPTMLRDAYSYLNSTDGICLLQRLLDMIGDTSNRNDDNSALRALRIEWLIVNDGSKDGTCRAVRDTFRDLSTINKAKEDTKLLHVWRTVSLKRNSGKGAAVKTGMGLATGSFRLMVDADGATAFGPGLEKLVGELERAMMRPHPVNSTRMVAAFGSRAHLQQEATAQRSFVRTLLMKAFHFFVRLFVSSEIQDTQCGFKLFTKSASDAIFGTMHLRRWAFDTEVVLLCDQLGILVLEVGVPWREVDGSKLSTSKLALAIVSITMLRDMMCVRTCYTFGIWKVKST